MTTTQTILDSIENRLRELNQEIDTLTAARSALDGRDAPPARRRRASASRPAAAAASPAAASPPAESPAAASPAAESPATASPARRARSRRRAKTRTGTDVVPAGRLEALLSENGGLTTSTLAERTNGNRDQVLTLLRELETAGRIRRTGQRRSTRWHAITDEDRIRERAAELARRRKRPAR
jgi:hypothetical protein